MRRLGAIAVLLTALLACLGGCFRCPERIDVNLNTGGTSRTDRHGDREDSPAPSQLPEDTEETQP